MIYNHATCPKYLAKHLQKIYIILIKKKKNYFTSSDPHCAIIHFSDISSDIPSDLTYLLTSLLTRPPPNHIVTSYVSYILTFFVIYKIWRGQGGEENSPPHPLSWLRSSGDHCVLSGISSDTSSDIFSGISSGILSGMSYLPLLSSGIPSDSLSDIFSGILSYITPGFSFWRVRSGAAHSARKLPGRGPALPTPLGSSPVEVRRCPLRSEAPRSRSGAAHSAQKLPAEARRGPLRCRADKYTRSRGPGMPTAMQSWRSGRRGEEEEEEEEGDALYKNLTTLT